MLGEILDCKREPEITKDRYAVAALKSNRIVGHLPRKVSKVCSLFLRRGGRIQCKVSGSRQFSGDLPQGGLEIPCVILFQGARKEIRN